MRIIRLMKRFKNKKIKKVRMMILQTIKYVKLNRKFTFFVVLDKTQLKQNYLNNK